ncbi:MAG: formate/nitrite transporter family protein [Clostridia bacterium]|nr:formate/nitrite transporter family protein [Clostridia bacterium]
MNMKKILGYFAGGVAAGILISLGGGVFLSAEERTVGAIFFSTALLCICMLGFNLYTGKICYFPFAACREKLCELLAGLCGNIVATLGCGYLISLALPAAGEAAKTLCDGKLDGQKWWQTLLRAFFCGMLVYLSVEIYRKHRTPVGIVFCIPTFILSGYEHSIADFFYFGTARELSVRSLLFLLTVILGNSAGGIILPLLTRAAGKKD